MLLCLPVLFGSARCAAQTTGSRATQIQDHSRRAAEAFKANDPRSAAEQFDAVLTLDPDNTEAKAMLGICERRLGRSSAQALLEISFPKLKDKNLRTQVGMELAGIYYQEGDLEHAAVVVQSLVAMNPDDADILYLAQLVYTELADGTLNKLTIIAPGSARMQQAIAEHLVNAGDLRGAISHYKKCLEINPRVPGVHYELAEAILESSPTDPAAQAEAQRELETALKTEGDSSKVECELARIALRQSDTQRAYAHYSRAFAVNPRETEAQVGLGRMLMSLGKPQEALKYLRMAVQSDPLNSEAHYRLALVYKRLHMTSEAQKEMGLFQEIKQTRNQVKELYRQMNKRPQASDDEISDTPQ